MDVQLIVKNVRQNFNTGKTVSLSFRRQQLERLYDLVKENESQFIQTLYQDLKKPAFEAKMIETDYVLNDIKGMLFNLNSYTKPKKVSKTLVLAFDDGYIQSEPYGVVLIIGTWNYPLMVCLSPLIGAIAAGNAAIIKPSEIAPKTAALIEKLIPQYIDENFYRIINGDAEVCEALLKEKFDYIFFTGSQGIGKLVHQAAAQHFTPCTLELGGKSPVYIDDTVENEEFAFRRIIWAKMVNAGQTCVAPDYVICSAKVMKSFIRYAQIVLRKFYGPNLQNKSDITRIVNEKHYKRLVRLLNSCKNVPIRGDIDMNQRFIGPTIVTHVQPDDDIMREEIFGPILPILTVNTSDEAIEFINSRPKPLTLYIFSKNRSTIDKFIRKTSSGSVCANDALIHLGIDTLPFGGVGESGFGVYHGKASFDTFSHQKSVLVRGYSPVLEWVASKRYPPYLESNLNRLLRLIRKRKVFYYFDESWQASFLFILGAITLYFVQNVLARYLV